MLRPPPPTTLKYSALSLAVQPPTDAHAPGISQHSQIKKNKINKKVMGAETLGTYVSMWYASSVASVYYYEYD